MTYFALFVWGLSLGMLLTLYLASKFPLSGTFESYRRDVPDGWVIAAVRQGDPDLGMTGWHCWLMKAGWPKGYTGDDDPRTFVDAEGETAAKALKAAIAVARQCEAQMHDVTRAGSVKSESAMISATEEPAS